MTDIVDRRGRLPLARRQPAARRRCRACRSVRTALVLVLAAATFGCTDGGAGSLTPDTFADVYVELRRAAYLAETEEGFEARKAEILERYGVTEPDLVAFAERHAEDVQAAAELWEGIRARLTPPVLDTVPS